MFLPNNYALSIFLMTITMVAWGSWANLSKVDKKWRFELFYWDYAIGIFLISLVMYVTLGGGGSLLHLFRSENKHALLDAFSSGCIFNLANILLVSAISIAGMAIAFPIGIGIALVLGTVLSFLVAPTTGAPLLFLGVFFVLLAIITDALAYKESEGGTKKTKKGVGISIASGILMSFFYPLISESMKISGALTPYEAFVVFSTGVLISNCVINPIFMRFPPAGHKLSFKKYLAGSPRQHLLGIGGGSVWGIGTGLNMIAATSSGPAIAYAFGQGATLVAALWGIYFWKELKRSKRVNILISSMFFLYIIGLVLIGAAKLT